jgi:cardiolipin synthase
MENFEIYSEPKKFYRRMIEDILNAKNYVYLETFLFKDDVVGRAFKKVLLKKVKDGVKIKLLVDAWNTIATKKTFFKDLEDAGIEVRYFRELKYVVRFVDKNHERNHRKLLLIDNQISYIGSANITAEFYPDGREIVMRLDGDITHAFVRAFMKSWRSIEGLNKKRIRNILHKGFEIIQDIPSEIYKVTERKYIKLINSARKEILLESPYFVPSRGIRKAFAKAIKRGVKVRLIIPYDSDTKIADIVRARYLGEAYRSGMEIFYYSSRLHSKLMIIDDKFFLLGSSNLDYRSFVHQFEINLLGRDKDMIKALKESYCLALRKCTLFDYGRWKERSSLDKFLDLFLLLIRRYV